MKKPSQEFFDTLGEYVYTYLDPNTGKMVYVGKGVGKRGMCHIKTKGYDLDDLHILGKNLERFENKPSLLLESFLISRYDLHDDDNVADNKVAGHYKECFEMSKLNFLFNEYEESKRNFFVECNELRDQLESYGNVAVIVARKSSFYVESSDKERRAFKIYVDSDGVSVSIWGKNVTDDWRDAFSKNLIDNGYEPITDNKKTISWSVKNLEEAMELWGDFTKG